MSKTSTSTLAADETVVTASEDTKTTETSSTSTTAKTTAVKEKKYTVYRFLQIEPQPIGYGTLLKKHYGNEWHTIKEWEALMQKILNRKVD